MIKIKNLTRVIVQGQVVLMLKEPIEVVYSALEGPIGHPQDIAANIKANGVVNFNLETPIPRPSSASTKN